MLKRSEDNEEVFVFDHLPEPEEQFTAIDEAEERKEEESEAVRDTPAS